MPSRLCSQKLRSPDPNAIVPAIERRWVRRRSDRASDVLFMLTFLPSWDQILRQVETISSETLGWYLLVLARSSIFLALLVHMRERLDT